MNRFHLNHFYDPPLILNQFQIIQIGRLYCKPGAVIEPHSHRNWFELTVVTSGTGTITTNHTSVSVKRHDIHLSFPADLHSIISDEQTPLEYDFFSFYTTDPVYLKELDALVLDHMPAESRIIRDERLSYLVQNIIREADCRELFGEHLLQSICEQIVIYLIRAVHSHDIQRPATSMSSSDILCYQIMNYIDTHVFSMQSLGELSEVFRYNYSYLSSFYKKNTGQSLMDYFQTKRLEMAKRLIQEGKLSITKISEMLNYSTVQNLSRAYKKKFGKAPSMCEPLTAPEDAEAAKS